MRGMEMMFGSLLKSLGLEPEVIMKNIESLARVAVNVEARTTQQQEILVEILTRLDRIDEKLIHLLSIRNLPVEILDLEIINGELTNGSGNPESN